MSDCRGLGAEQYIRQEAHSSHWRMAPLWENCTARVIHPALWCVKCIRFETLSVPCCRSCTHRLRCIGHSIEKSRRDATMKMAPTQTTALVATFVTLPHQRLLTVGRVTRVALERRWVSLSYKVLGHAQNTCVARTITTKNCCPVVG